MSEKHLSADDIRETERSEWAARGNAWDRWADRMAPLADRLNAPLLDAAGIAAGQSVLDLASGAGEPALTIARRVGPSGSVTATDLVPEMLAGARRRAAGIGNIRFELADMTALPFAPASFDRVTCRFGLMFAPDPLAALREARRVLRPGGIAAFMVWGPIENNTNFVVIDGVAKRLLNRSFFDRPIHPFRFAAAGALTPLLQEAGFAAAKESELGFAPKVEVGTPFWRSGVDMMLDDRLASLDAAARAAFDQAVETAFSPHRAGDHYQLHSHVRIAVGRTQA